MSDSRDVYARAMMAVTDRQRRSIASYVEALQKELVDTTEVLGYRDRDIEKFRKGTLAFTDEVARLQAEVERLQRQGVTITGALEREEERNADLEARVREL